ncbi:MAG: sensor domain-containing diguanylate cyclase [Clostridiales bacterium]|jgi:diguanylate cyclase (GGDEF)-like protein|nr:sensor domain-containing diguanylate cyclase [Clostridiales bacterium]
MEKPDIPALIQTDGLEPSFSVFFESMPTACVLVDEEGLLLRFNPAAAVFFDFDGGEEKRLNIINYCPEFQPGGQLSSDKAREQLRIAFAGGRTRSEWMFRTAQCEQLPAEVTIAGMDAGPGRIAAVFMTDLREIKRAVGALDEISGIAYTDSLTGLFNRRYFMERLNFECMVFDNLKQPIPLIMYDLDKFKYVNDTYGHPVGDEVLRQLSARVRKCLRSSDLLARYGGEEFIILAYGATPAVTEMMAWRLREAVDTQPFDCHGHILHITISLGVAVKTHKETTADELLQRADEALYAAKNNGRNRVEVYKGRL